MKKVILRFLKNKAVEIWNGKFILLYWIACALIGYVIGDFFPDPRGIWIIILLIIGALLTLVLVMIFVAWLKENWQRAKHEIKEEDKINIKHEYSGNPRML